MPFLENIYVLFNQHDAVVAPHKSLCKHTHGDDAYMQKTLVYVYINISPSFWPQAVLYILSIG